MEFKDLPELTCFFVPYGDGTVFKKIHSMKVRCCNLLEKRNAIVITDSPRRGEVAGQLTCFPEDQDVEKES